MEVWRFLVLFLKIFFVSLELYQDTLFKTQEEGIVTQEKLLL